MRHPLRPAVFLVLLSALASGTALAGSPYLGVTIGAAWLEGTDVDGLPYESTELGFKMFGGYRFLPYLAVEGGYVDLGLAEEQVDRTRIEMELQGVNVVLAGFFRPDKRVSPFLKAGAYFWGADGRSSDSGGVRPLEDSGVDLTYGLGLSIQLAGSIRVRAEYEVFDVPAVETSELFSAGITVNF